MAHDPVATRAVTPAAGGHGTDYVPARMVNEFVYCARLAYLEWVDGEWDDNLDTIEGRWAHRRVDAEPSTPVPDAEAPGEHPLTARSLMLSSDRLGAIAKLDLLEAEGKRATPVDYKRGRVPDVPAGAYDPERVQLCLQGLLLRDNGYECAGGVLYFVESRTRVEVPFDEDLVSLTEASVRAARGMAAAGKLPPPLLDSPKCPRCSLVGICLPDETRVWRGELVQEPRRLVPSRPDALPLYVQAQGGSIGKDGDCLKVTTPDGEPTRVRLLDVSSVALFGNVQITTPAMKALLAEGIPITLHTVSGWLSGTVDAGIGHRNVSVRMAQHGVASDPGASMGIARRLVEGKILNQRTLLRRNLPGDEARRLGLLAMYARQTRSAPAIDTLMGMEGMAARLYFEVFGRLFRGAGAWAGAVFAEHRRNRRPPKDEVNAVLSFLYALLVREVGTAVVRVGFDPYRGFLHQPHYGRPSLSLDLMEEFRPLVADSVAVRLFNEGELTSRDFVRRARAVVLEPSGRRRVIGAFERRLSQTVLHPLLGYSVSYRRVIELQARLLRAVLLGEAPVYRPFTTR
ncbi:CRISPR-associated endonuclease Cas1 [Gemmatimonas sp.]|uniref:CRISPR-associated endonuclease Cas4g/Cas1g n=1 Tax=Gemmatimonas sp. TaxID=1962908 RepID=UPI0025BD1402|nr:CRISPR-associated endonuclease Cas1 [Gemmatimonas sp.]